ncbi:PAS domain S-box protein [Hufsiella ginkgonis]|uniref:histidine kinase n=1 Tax=Hufsiella ginkgonis TaxID=2695274 RepID=A0A7K1XU61_9SPHI|nr:PAS domain S-box protein [Hufsiella ginkgonis]MXV14036.1 PAS domain S-box protein [Hufsiella ginkgonis]
MLASAFPTLICWGEDYIQLYNDPFRPINGKTKHPKAIGRSARDTYAEIWDTIGPMFGEVMNGRTVSFRDLMVPLDRNGYLENCYFDFSYSPIRNANGHVCGILVTCVETTEKVRAIERLNILQQNTRNMVRQAPVGMCVVKGSPLMVEEVNDLFLEIIGKRREQLETTPYWEVNAEAAAIYSPITDHVLQTGETYHAKEHRIMLIRNGKAEVIYVDFVYEPMRDVGGTVDAIMIVAIEVTDKVLARRSIEENSEEFQALNEELASANEEYAAINEELAAVNEELTVTNEELVETQRSLVRSEKLFRSIALNIPRSLIIMIDKDHRFITIEGDIMEKLGYNSKDYAGKHPGDITPERYEASRHLYDRVIAGEQFSVERTAATGEIYTVHFVPLRNRANEVEAGLIIALDITDIKQAEERSAKLAAIVESSDDAIISKTLESVITSWNDSAQRMFGYSAEEIIGETIYKLIPEDRHDEEPQIIDRLKKGERLKHFETKRLTKDGRLIDVSLTVSPLKDKQGNIIGASKIARDITEKKLEEQRKNDFVAMVSHELKTPLTTINSYIQLLLAKAHKEGDDFRINALTRTEVQAKKMIAMIHDFLSLVRITEGRIPLRITSFEFSELAHEIVADVQLLTSKHTISLVGCGGITLNADRDKIGQVLTNLLSNAVKYSPDGGRIVLGCETMNDKVKIYVSDEGMGISPDDQKKLFDRFYRANNDKLKTVSGFGIGLYLVSEILSAHNSKIEVESQENVGSTFYFILDRY